MIGRLHGKLLYKHPPWLLLDVNGVGYELECPMSTFYELPEVGRETTLVTHYAVKEDAVALYGFHREAERALFRVLIKVSGVGAKTALSVLSGVTVDAFAALVQAGDTAALTRVPGIGKKTAERLLLELKGRLAPELAGAGQGGRDATPAGTDVLRALLALGYSEKEAGAAVGRLPADCGVSEGIRQALKLLAKV